MSINYDEFVGLSAITWEQVYQAFKERLLADLQGRYELVEIHTWDDPPLEICEGCGMHPKSHLPECPVAAAELAEVDNGIGYCEICGKELHGSPYHTCQVRS